MSQAITAPAAGREAESDFGESTRWHALHSLLMFWEHLLPHERFKAVGLALRDRLIDAAVQTYDRYRAADAKTVYYLSMEFLIGRSLANNLVNLGLYDEAA